ncbi:hypothetical protein C6P46_003348 [Rhodotorula mucilaginosa]|uniref:BTB domain-containing protein n=1 Tax=Rhodotorula mucilaginosa TaxID=5537 RepID=A0A9P6W4I1_RHOMI|nr:hypothetical protein C6P46_003348 [Rhodotorula mucilaginosa]
MAAPAEDDTITLVTTDDPPVELAVERDKLLDSSVFSDMLSLPKTGDCKARVDVAETAADLEAWIEFLRSGKVEMPDNAGEESLGRKAVTIAKLVDKYGRLLAERRTHPVFIVLASDPIQADHVQRHAAAQVLALRAKSKTDRTSQSAPRLSLSLMSNLIPESPPIGVPTCQESQYIGSDKLQEWELEFAWRTLLLPETSRLIFNRSLDYSAGHGCQECNIHPDNAWRNILMEAGRDQILFEAGSRYVQKCSRAQRICRTHAVQFYDSMRELDQELRSKLPPFPPP